MRAHRCQQWLYMIISPGPAANHLEGGGRIRETQAQGLYTQAVPCDATCFLMCGLGRRGRARLRPLALMGSAHGQRNRVFISKHVSGEGREDE